MDLCAGGNGHERRFKSDEKPARAIFKLSGTTKRTPAIGAGKGFSGEELKCACRRLEARSSNEKGAGMAGAPAQCSLAPCYSRAMNSRLPLWFAILLTLAAVAFVVAMLFA
jgi:hypothetical protein